ncbi:hypothetical protein FGADI_1129 [Fusarium gaditjirri]|uniref:Isopenicillin N synthase-like Fe(2+) 2OG dioxygenase domain-containing protein n=1 Tax=Fusarium gaditjirri TaxID=282569 RepID=A0A8H4TLH8_9HYPO|nr:hypothetical protein FGADI_1129 [Fusarium gaditjirri]
MLLSSCGGESAVPAPVAINASPLLDTLVQALISSSAIFSFEPHVKAPFDAIRNLFDHLRSNAENSSSLTAAHPKRGIFKTAAMNNATSDQKFTIDLSPTRNSRIPEALREKVAGDGFHEVLDFFEEVNSTYVAQIISIMHELISADLSRVHKTGNLNYRLCDYNTNAADSTSGNGCGAHTDYGTFTIIFQEEHQGSRLKTPSSLVFGFLSPEMRQLSLLVGVKVVRPFTKKVMDGQLDVGEFKEVMGKKWRRREGNEKSDDGDDTETQDSEIERFIWA